MTQNTLPKQQRSSSGATVRGALDWPSQSPDINSIRACILPIREETEGSNPQNKQQLKETAMKVCRSITKEECKSLVMSVGHRLDAVIARKESASK